MPETPTSPWPRLSLRERKKFETRQRLSYAALRAALDHGIHNVRVEDIAEAADVSPRTFNNYYSSKYEAITAIAADRAERVGALLRETPDGEPLWDAITAAVTAQYRDIPEAEAKRDSLRSQELFAEPVLRGEYLKTRETMRRNLTGAIAERLGTDAQDDLVPHLVAAAVDAAVDLAIGRWRRGGPSVRVIPLIEQALREASRALNLT